ncbi:MAG: hypothetical protein AAF773_02425 [Cyanobacteria bacterium P01_D01_bin.115]
MDVSQKPDPQVMHPLREQISTKDEDTDEISLIDILKFLRQHFRIIGAGTLTISTFGMVAGLTDSPQTQRELLLSLTLPPEMTLHPIGSPTNQAVQNSNRIAQDAKLIQDKITVAGSLAINNDFPKALNQTQSLPISISLPPLTDETPGHLRLVLTSEDSTILKEASQKAIDILQVAADEVVELHIAPEIIRLDLLIQRTQAKITHLEKQLASTGVASTVESTALASPLQLPEQLVMAQEISMLIDYEFERASLSELQSRDESLVSIEVLLDSQTQVPNSLLQRLIFSTISGFMLSILIALIVDHWPQIKSALSSLDDCGHEGT